MTITIGRRLSEAMESKQIRAYELSKITGISTSNICNYRKNKYSPKSDNISKLAKALGVSEYWLLGLEDNESGGLETTKARVTKLLDKMTSEQLEKTEKFIIHVILEE